MIATLFAYLDPGSSSMIVQMLLGGVAAAGVALKLYWRRLLRFLRIRKDQPEESAPSAASASASAPDAATSTAAEREPAEPVKH